MPVGCVYTSTHCADRHHASTVTLTLTGTDTDTDRDKTDNADSVISNHHKR